MTPPATFVIMEIRPLQVRHHHDQVILSINEQNPVIMKLRGCFRLARALVHPDRAHL